MSKYLGLISVLLLATITFSLRGECDDYLPESQQVYPVQPIQASLPEPIVIVPPPTYGPLKTTITGSPTDSDATANGGGAAQSIGTCIGCTINGSSGGPGGQGCSQSGVETCDASCSNAYSACNAISPQAMAMIQSTMAQASNTTSTVSSGETVCKVGAALSTLMSGANVALAVTCQGKINACKSACAPTGKTMLNRGICSGQETQAIMSFMQALAFMQNTAQNMQCIAYWQNRDCSKRPTDPDCICTTNPSAPSCTAGASSAAGGLIGSMGAGLPDGPNPDIKYADQNAAAAPPSAPPAAGGAPGGGTGDPSLAGNAGKFAPEDPGAAAPGPYDTHVINGTTGGGGGGNPYASGRPGGGSSGESPSMLSSLADRLNLKGFLPKSDYKNRGLAGMSSTGRDGMTGPNGPSLWEKVSNQYQQKKGDLLP